MESKQSISVVIQCFSIVLIAVTLWLVFISILAFGHHYTWVTDFSYFFLQTDTDDIFSSDIPLTVFILFQSLFGFIVPVILLGLFVKQIHFKMLLLFASLWLVLIYAPLLLVSHVIFSMSLI